MLTANLILLCFLMFVFGIVLGGKYTIHVYEDALSRFFNKCLAIQVNEDGTDRYQKFDTQKLVEIIDCWNKISGKDKE